MPQASQEKEFLHLETKYQVIGAVLFSFYLFPALKNMPLPLSTLPLKSILHPTPLFQSK